MKSKSDVPHYFRMYKENKELQTGRTIKAMRFDGRSEYKTIDFHGITRQISAPYTQHQNGVSERLNRTLITMSRCMLSHAHLPLRFWDAAVLTACYLRNRLPILENNLTPFEAMNDHPAKISHLKVWGCVCYVLIEKTDLQRYKLKQTSLKSIFVGYCESITQYQVYIPSKPGTNKVIISANVKFQEESFWDWSESTQQNLNEEYILSDTQQPTLEADSSTDSEHEGDFLSNPAVSPSQSPINLSDNISGGVQGTTVDTLEESSEQSENLENSTELLESQVVPNIPANSQVPNVRRISRQRKQIAPRSAWQLKPGALYVEKETYIPKNFSGATKGVDKEKWQSAIDEELKSLKSKEVFVPVTHVPHGRKTIGSRWVFAIKSDGRSDYVTAGVLSQYNSNGILQPVAYFSKKHSPAECNYEIYDKELLAIIRAFEEWRPELEGAAHPIAVISDHKNLEYFMSTKQLSRRQARWAEYLSRFNFVIKYRPGKQGGKPDALTRRSEDLPKEGDDRKLHQTTHAVVNSGISKNELESLFVDGYNVDPFPEKILQLLRRGDQYSKEISLAECEEIDMKLTYRGKTYVPDHDPLKLQILKLYHDDPSAGHPGREKTFELASRDYFWPSMRKYIARYVRNCHSCRRSKPNQQAKQGVLRLLPIARQPWQEISMDFVTGLPLSEGYDAIMVVVDRLTKMRHLIPCHTTVNSKDVAILYLNNVWKIHGLPTHVTSDRRTQFTANFWKNLCKHLGIQARMSTAFHPETNGQTERFNAVMEQYLRSYISYQQDDWVQWLPMAEFAANNQVSSSTKVSPFYSNYGYHPRFTVTIKQTIYQIYFKPRCQRICPKNEKKPAPRLKVGDLVFLSSKHIRTTRNSQKLDWKKLGPFPVKQIISPYAYCLDLPKSMKIHPVFHVSLLELAASEPVPGQVQLPPPPIIIDGEEEFEVEQIYDSRLTKRSGLQYLVKWTRENNTSWEPAINMDDTVAVEKFHAQYPYKPGPFNHTSAKKPRRSSRLNRGPTITD
ncbi:hypothetical protein K3495_g13560 [Podosphaera aphanis]|nr:hypothetical protein K3495_g13560 [Podosphaera aphanis]